jgi:hypothetical protein
MAAGVVADILDRIGCRAIDPGSDTGFFNPETAAQSLAAWRVYRLRVVGRDGA